MDYGTGHELSFALFCCVLSLVRFFPFGDASGAGPASISNDSPLASLAPGHGPELPSAREQGTERKEDQTLKTARSLALTLYPRYLRLTWRLQDTYNLEPAGSHGVWGLDDSSFLGYIWGSGQMRGLFFSFCQVAFQPITDDCSRTSTDSSLPPSSILSLLPSSPSRSSAPSTDSTPTPPAPSPSKNLYALLISRIHAVKRGPFHEHSSQLYSIALGVKGWGKVNSGLIKMFEVGLVFFFIGEVAFGVSCL
jgi:serine/threonine-protein phosphatase 2A activator